MPETHHTHLGTFWYQGRSPVKDGSGGAEGDGKFDAIDVSETLAEGGGAEGLEDLGRVSTGDLSTGG